uniref:Uncharacterized protein n=1 Tax=Arundo donax TaxID=35708 RepID=A0A0A9AK79_ARUDO
MKSRTRVRENHYKLRTKNLQTKHDPTVVCFAPERSRMVKGAVGHLFGYLLSFIHLLVAHKDLSGWKNS